VFGGSAREFYAPLLPDPKTYSFFMDFKSLPRIEKDTINEEKISPRQTFTLDEITQALGSNKRVIKDIKSKIIENNYEFVGKNYTLKDKSLFEEILKEKETSNVTLSELVSEIVSRY
jgi:hypothetical protein